MRFLPDQMCGGIVAHLRMCGHDVHFADDSTLESDEGMLARADAEGRTIVTRNRTLGSTAPDAIVLETTDPGTQLAELHAAGVPLELADPPTYCGRCNGRLESIPEGVETPPYAPDPEAEACCRCEQCGQILWRGSHWSSVRETLASAADQ